MVLYGPQGNSLGLLYALANKFTVFSQVYSTTGKQVSPPSSPSAALANFLYQPTLCLMQNFSPITYLSKGIRWLLCECKLVTIQSLYPFSLFLNHLILVKMPSFLFLKFDVQFQQTSFQKATYFCSFAACITRRTHWPSRSLKENR